MGKKIKRDAQKNIRRPLKRGKKLPATPDEKSKKFLAPLKSPPPADVDSGASLNLGIPDAPDFHQMSQDRPRILFFSESGLFWLQNLIPSSLLAYFRGFQAFWAFFVKVRAYSWPDSGLSWLSGLSL